MDQTYAEAVRRRLPQGLRPPGDPFWQGLAAYVWDRLVLLALAGLCPASLPWEYVHADGRIVVRLFGHVVADVTEADLLAPDPATVLDPAARRAAHRAASNPSPRTAVAGGGDEV
jgi:hypothetical protein